MASEIVNKVASSALKQFDLEELYPKEPVVEFDLRNYLFMELILKEKDFREKLQQVSWAEFNDKMVGVTCTADAIIPMWAYMLVTSYLQPHARNIYFGDAKEALKQEVAARISAIDAEEFRDQRVVVKGCGDIEIGPYAYLEITKKLRPVAKSIMYGEPCSTVPVFKSAKKPEGA